MNPGRFVIELRGSALLLGERVSGHAAFQQAGGAGEFSGLDTAGAAELGQDIAHMTLRRLLADREALSDLTIGHAIDDEGQHLALTARQRTRRAIRRGGPPLT